MSSEHLFFIPVVLLAGAALGYIFGRKLLVAEQQERALADARRASRKAQGGEL